MRMAKKKNLKGIDDIEMEFIEQKMRGESTYDYLESPRNTTNTEGS